MAASSLGAAGTASLYQVGEAVFADVEGFEPFPALVENIVYNEIVPAIYYHVKLLGSQHPVALDGDNLMPFEENKHRFRVRYNKTELIKEAKARERVLLGDEDDVPDALWKYVSIESDLEEVPKTDVEKLGLSNIILTASELSKRLTLDSSELVEIESDSDDEIVVDDSVQDSTYMPSANKAPQGSITCSGCQKRFQSLSALKKHKLLSQKCPEKLFRNRNSSISKENPNSTLKSILKANNPQEVYRPSRAENTNSKWVEGREGNCLYTCKLCFRKFLSKPRFESHMKTHTPPKENETEEGGGQRKSPPASKPASLDLTNSDEDEDSDDESSNSGGNGKRKNIHNILERERRAEMSSRFAELAKCIGLKGGSKLRTLEEAREIILELQKEEESMEKQRVRLKDLNLRLNARLMGLKSGF